jgi:hypothetical protein
MMFKQIIFRNIILISAIAATFSCKKDDDKDDTPAPTTGPVELTGNLSTQTLDASKKYLLKGYVYVQSGQVLTIPAGTVVFGDKATKGTLIINKGGRILAEGTADKPIVFTSKLGPGERDKGDWGGLIILGSANTNQTNPAIEGVSPAVNYGTKNSTANDAENSGILKFVRVEFAGIALSPNNETNSITFGGVGSGTICENVMVSYGGDDGFEWFGGTVNGKNLVSHATWDDDFDADFGYTGKVQYALAVRDPFSADQSGSNAFESDNNAGGTEDLPLTAPVFSNVTVFGPRHDSTSSISGNYQHAAHLRRRTALSLFNSVITGFPVGIRLDGKTTYDNYANGTADIKNNLLISLGNRGAAKPFEGGTNTTISEVEAYYSSNNPAGYITMAKGLDYAPLGIDVNLFFSKSAVYPANPNYSVSSGVISSGANFTHSKLQGSFFQNVNYHGAFGGTDWTDTWTNFDPKSTAY